MQTWEYRVEHITGQTYEIAGILNGLGRDGWELVLLLGDTIFIFKRPKT